MVDYCYSWGQLLSKEARFARGGSRVEDPGWAQREKAPLLALNTCLRVLGHVLRARSGAARSGEPEQGTRGVVPAGAEWVPPGTLGHVDACRPVVSLAVSVALSQP